MPPGKRAEEMARARAAGYHGDGKAFIRLVCERKHISLEVARKEWDKGVKAKRDGVPCECAQCA